MKLRVQKLIGIEFGSASIRMVKINGAGLVVRAGRAEMPNNQSIEPTNEEADKEALDLAVRSTLRRAARNAGIRGGRCALCVGGSDIILRQFTMPYMDAVALKMNAVHEIQAYVALSLENYYVDYKVQSFTTSDEGVIQLKVLVVAVNRNRVNRLMRLAKEAGFKPIYVDVAENTREKLLNALTKGVDLQRFNPVPVAQQQARAAALAKRVQKKQSAEKKRNQVKLFTPEKDRTVEKIKKKTVKRDPVYYEPPVINAAIIALGTTYTNITIVLNRRYYISRYISTCSNTILEAIMAAENVSMAQAAALAAMENFFEDNSISASAESVRGIVDLLIGEISSVIDYCFYRERNQKVDHLYITGKMTTLPGLKPYLEESFGIPVHSFDQMVRTVFHKRLNKLTGIASYTNALGVTIREVME